MSLLQDAVLDAAASQPEGTFGHAYGHFMGRRHFRADERPPVRFLDDRELAYVAQRARETHDLWHVLFNCPTTVLGELTLKGLEFVQARNALVHVAELAAKACIERSVVMDAGGTGKPLLQMPLLSQAVRSYTSKGQMS